MSDIRRLLASLDAISEASPIDAINPAKKEYKSVLDPDRYSADQARRMGLIGDKDWAARKEQEQAVERLYPEQLVGGGLTKGVGKPSVWTSGRTGQPMTPPAAPKPKVVIRPGETAAQAVQRAQSTLQKPTTPAPSTTIKPDLAASGTAAGARGRGGSPEFQKAQAELRSKPSTGEPVEPGMGQGATGKTTSAGEPSLEPGAPPPPPKGFKDWDQYWRMNPSKDPTLHPDTAKERAKGLVQGPPNKQVPPSYQKDKRLWSPSALPLGPYDKYGPQPGGGGKQGTEKADGATPAPQQSAPPPSTSADTTTTRPSDLTVQSSPEIDLPRISGEPSPNSPFVVAGPKTQAPAPAPAKVPEPTPAPVPVQPAPVKPAEPTPAPVTPSATPSTGTATGPGSSSGTGGGQGGGIGTGTGTGIGAGGGRPGKTSALSSAEKDIPGMTRESLSKQLAKKFESFIESYDISIRKKK